MIDFDPISWVVGILEGEGSFDSKGNSKRIRIVNTDKDIIDRCEEYLIKNYVIVKINERQRKGIKLIYEMNICKYANEFYKLIKSRLQCRTNEIEKIFNTQASSCTLSIDPSWLVGIFEAEGNFSINHSKKKYFDSVIYVGNTNMKIIDKIKVNLQAFNCNFTIQNRLLYTNKKHTSIYLSGIKNQKKFLDYTQNCWQSSRNIYRTSLILEFINSRLSKEFGSNYSTEEVQIYHAVKGLN